MSASDHGSASTYSNWDCRCDACKAAWSAYVMAARPRRAARLTSGDDRHGRYTTYCNWQCRCEPCRDAWAVYSRQHRAAS